MTKNQTKMIRKTLRTKTTTITTIITTTKKWLADMINRIKKMM